MRTLGLVAVVLSVGCASQTDTMFTHQGQVMAQSNGVVLSDDGNEGMAGMFGTTCIFNARNGQMGGDFDIAGPDEVVEDTNDSGIVLTRSSTGIHEISPYGGEFREAVEPNNWQGSIGTDQAFTTTELNGVIGARWLGDTVVALVDDDGQCAVHYLGDAPAVVALSKDMCDGFTALEAGVSDTTIFVSTQNTTVSVRDGVVSPWGAGADSLSWDELTQVMYVVSPDGHALQAFSALGELSWQAESSGVSSITHMGPHGFVASMEQDGVGRGLLVVRDGRSGAVIEATSTPSAGQQMTVSKDGSTLAIAVQDYIHLFSIH